MAEAIPQMPAKIRHIFLVQLALRHQKKMFSVYKATYPKGFPIPRGKSSKFGF